MRLVVSGGELFGFPGNTLGSVNNFTNHPAFNALVSQLVADALDVKGADDHHQSQAHVEDAFHFIRIDIPELLNPGKNGRNGPTAPLNDSVCASRQDAIQVSMQSAPGDMGDTMNDMFDLVVRQNVPHRFGIDPGRFQEYVPYVGIELRDFVFDC